MFYTSQFSINSDYSFCIAYDLVTSAFSFQEFLCLPCYYESIESLG